MGVPVAPLKRAALGGLREPNTLVGMRFDADPGVARVCLAAARVHGEPTSICNCPFRFTAPLDMPARRIDVGLRASDRFGSSWVGRRVPVLD